ncbi:MAG: hypothetical protein BGN97_04435 [Microbacterium sp. 69-10]|uniref:hypothetical protein n=1 Tax=Microbacterium sp. 69-10 TaxID=1895783 RepID=UPI0009600B75|nr:hypothetical protein [Microbacterium sp. 69-10]OJU42010.1 MAG: hypothetical protein BGN97_04435 [Microbacterium sp. 69-10]
MKALYATEAVNVVQDGDAVRMVCEFCGLMSGRRSEAGLVELPRGWAMTPFPDHVVHPDGSHGARYRCNACAKRRDFPLTPREYLRPEPMGTGSKSLEVHKSTDRPVGSPDA